MPVIESTVQDNSFVTKAINFFFIEVHFYEYNICFCNKIAVLDCIFYCIDNTYSYIIQVTYIEFYQKVCFINRQHIRL
jgi:hypothetical protein